MAHSLRQPRDCKKCRQNKGHPAVLPAGSVNFAPAFENVDKGNGDQKVGREPGLEKKQANSVARTGALSKAHGGVAYQRCPVMKGCP